MREGIGIKDWITQGKNRSTHPHQGKVLLALPTVWQEQDCKHGQAAMIERQAIGPRNLIEKIPQIQADQLKSL